MRAILHSKSILLMALLSTLCLASCVEEEIDLTNVDTTIGIDGSYALPLLFSDAITVSDLVNEYGHADGEFGIAIVDIGGEQLLCFTTERTFQYSIDENKEINRSFANLQQSLENGDYKFEVTAAGDIGHDVLTEAFDDVLGPQDRHEIHRIYAKGDFQVIVSAGTFTVGTKTFTGGPTDVNEIDINSDEIASATAPCDITLQLKPGGKLEEVIVYGWFDYKLMPEQNDSTEIDLSSELQNSEFILKDPYFVFDVKTDKLGTPIIFNIRQLQTTLGTAGASLSLSGNGLAGGMPFLINPAPSLTEKGTTNVAIDQFHNLSASEALAWSRLVDSRLKKINFAYDLYSDSEAYDRDLNTSKIQFISSKAKIDLHAQAYLPAWFAGKEDPDGTYPGSSGFYFEHNIEVDLEDDSFDFGEVMDSLDIDNAQVILHVQYTNGIALRFQTDLKFYNALGNELVWTDDNKTGKEFNFFERPDVGLNGEIIAPKTGYFDIELKGSEVRKLQQLKPKKMTLHASSAPVDKSDPAHYFDRPVKVHGSDVLQVKAGLIVTGKFSANPF